MSAPMAIEKLFETPLIFDQLPDAAALCADLKVAILARRQQDRVGRAVSNRLGWHSDANMLEWGGPAAMQILEQVIETADRYTLDIAAQGTPRYAWVPEMWANISAHGASNQIHAHPGSYWSAVFYVDDGYAGSADRALGGEIELEDPRAPMIHMEAPDLRFRERADAPVEAPEVLVRPGSGRLIMFPSWLRHGVRPYFGSGSRISVAINLTAVRV